MNHSQIAIAIFAGFLVMSAAIYFKDTPLPSGKAPDATAPLAAAPDTSNLGDPGRTEKARVYGNPNAAIKIVEFSDFECPFCARLHPTLKQLVDTNPDLVYWEYRHLPLPNHPNAFPAAVASECVADLAGIDAFWAFSDSVFAALGTQSAAFFKQEATRLGVSSTDYDNCINSPEAQNLVRADLAKAQSLGAQGTPFSVIYFPDGKTQVVSGAYPYEQWQTYIAGY